jgi:hypothetical protein
MQIPVLVEPVAGGGFVAKAGSPFGWSAGGATAEEAVANLRAEAVRHSATGTRVTAIEWPEPAGEHPLAKWAGTWRDDPMIDAFRKAIEEYRDAIDNDPNVP